MSCGVLSSTVLACGLVYFIRWIQTPRVKCSKRICSYELHWQPHWSFYIIFAFVSSFVVNAASSGRGLNVRIYFDSSLPVDHSGWLHLWWWGRLKLQCWSHHLFGRCHNMPSWCKVLSRWCLWTFSASAKPSMGASHGVAHLAAVDISFEEFCVAKLGCNKAPLAKVADVFFSPPLLSATQQYLLQNSACG